jgi:hypothetical protein
MSAIEAFEQALTHSERQVVARLTTPRDIQAFLDELTYSAEAVYRCPLRVLRERIAHWFWTLCPAPGMTTICWPFTSAMGIEERESSTSNELEERAKFWNQPAACTEHGRSKRHC